MTVATLPRDESLKYGYDGANHLSRIDYPADFSVNYQRNSAGQVASVGLAIGAQPPTSIASNISYLPFGPLKSLTWGNGIALSRQFDQDFQMTRQSIGDWQSAYGYDLNGNITYLPHSLFGNVDYQYDPLDRLIEEKVGTARKAYSYDATGNRKQRITYSSADGTEKKTASQTLLTAAASNRLAKNGSVVATLDAVGNTLQQTTSRRFIYDQQGRLQQVLNPDALYADYRYNALGQRTLKQVYSGASVISTTTFLYGADGQLLGQVQYGSTGKRTLAQYWIWLDGTPLAGVEFKYASNGTTLASTRQFYLHSDHLNTPRLATDQSQKLLWSWNSDAFGVGAANTDADGDGIKLDVPLRFPGQQYDAHSGLNYNYFRDYDPNTGRYVESDPIGLRGGLNTFGYVGSNPLIAVDMLGLTALHFYPNTGMLIVDPSDTSDPNSSYYVPAESGRPGCECDETTRDQGPIPRGNYTAQTSNLTNPGPWGDRLRNLRGDWGDWRMPLLPNDGTQTYGRNGFFLHGGQLPGSAGCIDIGGGLHGDANTNRVLNDIMSDPDGVVPVTVH